MFMRTLLIHSWVPMGNLRIILILTWTFKILVLEVTFTLLKLKTNFIYPPYSLSPDEKKLFCEVLKGVKFPAGYAYDIRHNVHVNEKKVFGLKSHECHIVLQDLLPLAVRKILPEIVLLLVLVIF